jgi:hypothetical protein
MEPLHTNAAPLADAALAELEHLDNAADTAPWFAYAQAEGDADGPIGWDYFLTPQEGAAHDADGNYNDFASLSGDNASYNAELIVAMRNALPGLLARLRAAEARPTIPTTGVLFQVGQFWIPFRPESEPCFEDLVWAKNEAQEVEGCLFVDGEFHFKGGRVFTATHWMPRMIKPLASLPVGTEQQLNYFTVKGGQQDA